MAFSEPNQSTQSNVHPGKAAQLWPNMTALAISPCVSSANGAGWWLDAWDKTCTALYGHKCEFDFPCTHAYSFPSRALG